MSFQNLYIKNISMKNYLIETLHCYLLHEVIIWNIDIGNNPWNWDIVFFSVTIPWNGKPLIEGTYKFNAAFMCLVPANMSHLKIGPEFVNLGILILQNLII